MPLLAAEELIVPRLPAFSTQHPQIEHDIRASDIFEDIESGCDAGLRLGESLEADMIAVRASGPRRSLIVAASSYFERYPKPEHPRDVGRNGCRCRISWRSDIR